MTKDAIQAAILVAVPFALRIESAHNRWHAWWGTGPLDYFDHEDPEILICKWYAEEPGLIPGSLRDYWRALGVTAP